MDIRTAGTQKFFRIEIADRGGYAMELFPCDGRVTKIVVINSANSKIQGIDKFAMKIGGNSFPKGTHSNYPSLRENPNAKPKIVADDYKFKKRDIFTFDDLAGNIKEVILYFQ